MAVTRAEAGIKFRGESRITGPKLGRPTLKQLILYWSTTDKYTKLRNVRLEVNHIFQACYSNSKDTVSVTPVHTIKNSPIQNQDTIHPWTRPILGKLVVVRKSLSEQGQGNAQHKDKY